MPATYTDRIDGLTTSVAVKAPCRVATTAAITLSGEQTIDGVDVVAGDRVLVKDQAITINNGIYVADTSVWLRALDFDGNRDVVKGTIVVVNEGATYAGSIFKVDSDATGQTIEIDTDTITFDRREDFTPNNVSDFGTTAGSTTAHVGVTLPVTTAYEVGRVYTGIAGYDAGVAATIDLGPGAVNIKVNGAATEAQVWLATDALVLLYDGTNMQLLSPRRKLASLTVTGNATVGGTLGVTGNTTLGGTLGVTGTATVGAVSTAGAVSSASVSATGNINAASYSRGGTAMPAPFVSTAQTITAGGALTIAHGLGVKPNGLAGWLNCTSDELGYVATNNRPVFIPLGQQYDGTTNKGVQVEVDATNLYVRFSSAASTFVLLNASSGVAGGITNNKWTITFKAWV